MFRKTNNIQIILILIILANIFCLFISRSMLLNNRIHVILKIFLYNYESFDYFYLESQFKSLTLILSVLIIELFMLVGFKSYKIEFEELKFMENVVKA